MIDKFFNTINKLAIALDVSLVYFSPVGIKYFNPPISRSVFDYFVLGRDVLELSADKLFVGPDNLKDKYTLLGRPISNSPYVEFMQLLNMGKDIKNTEYIKRIKNGTLDIRRPHLINSWYIESSWNKFESKRLLIERDIYDPIKCFSINGKYYIADGKHTAALCKILNVTPKCVDVSFLKYDSWFLWIYYKMQKKPNEYRKHLSYFAEIFQ